MMKNNNNGTPLVSVIITTFRRSPELVSRALKSVLAQTYPRIQVIVVEDSPEDYPEREDVHQTVQSLCPQVIFLSTGGNHGAPVARNMGIRVSEGEYIAFLDDDDEWLPNKIADQMTCFVSEEIALSFGQFMIVEEAERFQYPGVKEWHFGSVYEPLLKTNFIGTTSVPLMRKSCVEAIAGFDEEMQSAQDYDLYLRLAQKYKIGYTRNVCAIYHMHEGTRISTDMQAKIQGHERLVRKYAADLECSPAAWASQYRILSMLYRSNGEMRKALKTWMLTVRKMPTDILRNMKWFLLALVKPDFPPYRLYLWLKNRLKGLILKTEMERT